MENYQNQEFIALNTADAFSFATPADSRPAGDVIGPTAGSHGVAKERMENKDGLNLLQYRNRGPERN